MKDAIIKGKILDIVSNINPELARKYEKKSMAEIPDPDRLIICKILDAEYHHFASVDGKKHAGILASISKFFKKVGIRLSNFGNAQSWEDLGLVQKTEPEKREYNRNFKTGVWKCKNAIMTMRRIFQPGEEVEVLGTELEPVTNNELLKVKFGNNIYYPYSAGFQKYFFFLR